MDGVLWQTGSPPELFTGFGPSVYFSGQSVLETLEVALEHREVRRRRMPFARHLRASTAWWIAPDS